MNSCKASNHTFIDTAGSMMEMTFWFDDLSVRSIKCNFPVPISFLRLDAGSAQEEPKSLCK